MNNDSNTVYIENLEKRVSKIEEQQENHYEKIIENNTQLRIIVEELKSITKSMENLTISWKEAIANSEEKNQIEKNQINNRLDNLEKVTNELVKTLDNRTIGKNSEKWEKTSWIIISGIVGAIVTLICTNVIK